MSASMMKRLKHAYDRWTHGGATCAEVEGFLFDYVEGTLDARKTRVFEAHLKACPLCVAFLEDYKRGVAMAQAAGTPHVTQAPRDLVDAVVKALER